MSSKTLAMLNTIYIFQTGILSFGLDKLKIAHDYILTDLRTTSDQGLRFQLQFLTPVPIVRGQLVILAPDQIFDRAGKPISNASSSCTFNFELTPQLYLSEKDDEVLEKLYRTIDQVVARQVGSSKFVHAMKNYHLFYYVFPFLQQFNYLLLLNVRYPLMAHQFIQIFGLLSFKSTPSFNITERNLSDQQEMWNLDADDLAKNQKTSFLYQRLGISASFLVNCDIIIATLIFSWLLYFLSVHALQQANRVLSSNQSLILVPQLFNKAMRFLVPYIHECLFFPLTLYIGLGIKQMNFHTFFNGFNNTLLLATMLYLLDLVYQIVCIFFQVKRDPLNLRINSMKIENLPNLYSDLMPESVAGLLNKSRIFQYEIQFMLQ